MALQWRGKRINNFESGVSMTIYAKCGGVLLALGLLSAGSIPTHTAAAEPANLVIDGSFEQTMPRNQFGHVFKNWGGWKYEGDCEFRVGELGHTGQHSCLLFGASAPKIRAS